MARFLLEELAEIVGDLPAFLGDNRATPNAARRSLLSQVGDGRRARVDDAIAQAEIEAAERFSAVRSGHGAPVPSPTANAESSLIHPSGVDDPEADERSRLQGVLTQLLGESQLEALDVVLRAAAD